METTKKAEAFFEPELAKATQLRKARLYDQPYAGTRKISSFIPFTEFVLLSVTIGKNRMRRVMCLSEDVQWLEQLQAYAVPPGAFIYEFTNEQWDNFAFYTVH